MNYARCSWVLDSDQLIIANFVRLHSTGSIRWSSLRLVIFEQKFFRISLKRNPIKWREESRPLLSFDSLQYEKIY